MESLECGSRAGNPCMTSSGKCVHLYYTQNGCECKMNVRCMKTWPITSILSLHTHPCLMVLCMEYLSPCVCLSLSVSVFLIPPPSSLLSPIFTHDSRQKGTETGICSVAQAGGSHLPTPLLCRGQHRPSPPCTSTPVHRSFVHGVPLLLPGAGSVLHLHWVRRPLLASTGIAYMMSTYPYTDIHICT